MSPCPFPTTITITPQETVSDVEALVMKISCVGRSTLVLLLPALHSPEVVVCVRVPSMHQKDMYSVWPCAKYSSEVTILICKYVRTRNNHKIIVDVLTSR